VKQFGRATLIDPGLIGASLGLALKEPGLAKETAGVGRRESSLGTALKGGH